MNNKSWYASVTIWSSILAVTAGIFGDTVIGQIVADPQAAEALASAAVGIAGMFAIWGRIRASKNIGKKVKE